ncbi:Hsp33 family molecular chaperone HslO [Thalassotalea sp. 1_MG-2023]|uniref:Hsp33 family molecular chaperone HslO n=1 Tax=Thalassotalea sp. 1_MG-2023 TaxID=3062680 RepID=UPI0026E36D34|nr:Hsp33 family molecular chaperone HslO [Thalassotalea sp. 1_MG-2023]MDO6425699.1 Hsp33 family molecular chaperone HslO [Thalassotalea sp. 1_MG-2023]
MPADELNRYLFDDLHVRGELVQLSTTYQNIINGHNYPEGVKKLLGELIAVTSLLTATLKIEGEIAVQLQGDGPADYFAVNANHNQEIRAIAKVNESATGSDLNDLVGKGNMIITIRPDVGEAYQGVVALEHDNLADCIAHYFEVSEQIPTKIWLFHNQETNQIAGSLIQLLPDSGDKEEQMHDFEHLCQITATIKDEEIFTLDAKTLLYRLYHQEKVRLFEPQVVTNTCGCSEEKCLTAISQLGQQEVESILAEQGSVSMTCDYCLTTYAFYHSHFVQLFNQTKH